MSDVDAAIEELTDAISEIADDTERWTVEESAEIYEALKSLCTTMYQDLSGRL